MSYLKEKDITNNRTNPNKKRTANTYVTFQVSVPKLDRHHKVCIMGSRKEIGSWDKAKYVKMNCIGNTLWSKEIRLNKKSDILHFKFGIYDSKTENLISLELGEDRYVYDIDFVPKKPTLVKVKSNYRYSNVEWHGAGVAIPVFSLRSENGMGVGEFDDIKVLVDWCKKTGMKMIQILPVNDTVHTRTWVDSYPYSAISIFALHPIYLNIESIGNIPAKLKKQLQKNKTLLNENETIDYEAVMRTKSIYYKQIYDFNKKRFFKDPEFLKFFNNNKEWLVPYACL